MCKPPEKLAGCGWNGFWPSRFLTGQHAFVPLYKSLTHVQELGEQILAWNLGFTMFHHRSFIPPERDGYAQPSRRGPRVEVMRQQKHARV
jgi:hypothetical protein